MKKIIPTCLFELLIFAVILVIAFYFLSYPPSELPAGSVASLVGALIGADAILLGNILNRTVDAANSRKLRDAEVVKIKQMISAELINVACSLIAAKKFIDIAVSAKKSGGQGTQNFAISHTLPRAMPFTEGLGAKLLCLDNSTVDAIVVLKSNLYITQQKISSMEIASRLDIHSLEQLSCELKNDMVLLAKAISCVAPGRKISMEGGSAESVVDILLSEARSFSK